MFPCSKNVLTVEFGLDVRMWSTVVYSIEPDSVNTNESEEMNESIIEVVRSIVRLFVSIRKSMSEDCAAEYL